MTEPEALDPLTLAFALADSVVGRTSPNPAVGAVIVAPDGEVVGEGATQPPGGPHAEIVALRQAGDHARGATLYVTLEPCNHQGRTPPCTEAILAGGIARVVAAYEDPDPKVAGAGLARLAAEGVRVDLDEIAAGAAASRFYAPYTKHRREGRPFVTAKFAVTLDGKIASVSGESRWISGPEARAWAHRQRARSDAVLVGSGTVIADNPQLTVRLDEPGMEFPQPLRVVLDSRGRVEPSARVLGGAARTLVLTTDQSSPSWRAHVATSGAEIGLVPAKEGRLDLLAALGLLAQRGVVNLVVEGGGAVLGSFFDAGLVDRVTAVVAPAIVGSREALSPVDGRGAHTMAEVTRLVDVEVERLGDDVLIVGRPARPGDGAHVGT